MADKEKRAERYKSLDLNVVYDTGDDYWSARLVDASETGLFIETAHELAPGTEVTLMLEGNDDARLPFEMRGTVVRVQELLWEDMGGTPGIAVRLRGLTPHQVAEFHAFLAEHGTRVD
jgi:hypothetical protein